MDGLVDDGSVTYGYFVAGIFKSFGREGAKD